MSINEAIRQIDSHEQEIPSNYYAGKGLSDAVCWHEVREWLESMKGSKS